MLPKNMQLSKLYFFHLFNLSNKNYKDMPINTIIKEIKEVALGYLHQGWAIPGFAHQYYTQYYTGQKLLSNTNTQYQYYTKSKPTIGIKLVRFICLNVLELGINQLPHV